MAFAVPSPGPTLVLVTQVSYSASLDRQITYADIDVTSPTGAPVDFDAVEEPNQIELRIGNADDLVAGTQTYVITSTVVGLVMPNSATRDGDVVEWPLISDRSDGTPVAGVRAAIHGPADASSAYLVWSNREATSAVAGSTASFTALSPSVFTAGAVWPVGTFPTARFSTVAVTAVTELSIDATADTSGTFSVTQKFEINFVSPTKTPCLTMPTTRPFDDRHVRLVKYSAFTLSTDAAAPVRVSATKAANLKGYLAVCLGDPGGTVEGAHTYVLTYSVSGLIDQYLTGRAVFSTTDGPFGINGGWTLPIVAVSVVIHSPAPPDPDYTGCGGVECTRAISGSSITFTFGGFRYYLWVQNNPSLTIEWDGRPFPNYRIALASSNPFLVSYGGQYPVAVSALIAALAMILVWRVGRGSAVWMALVGSRRRNTPARDMPPNLPPYAAAAILTDKPDRETAIGATVVSLAAQGCLRIRLEGDDFTLVRVGADSTSLDPGERAVYDALFADGDTVSRQTTAGAAFGARWTVAWRAVVNDVHQRHWYWPDERRRYRRTVGVGLSVGATICLPLALLVVGVIASRQGVQGIGWFAVPLLLVGIVLTKWVGQRPIGTDVNRGLARDALGFRDHLARADVATVLAERGPDAVAAYTAYAMAYGRAEQWLSALRSLDRPGPGGWFEVANERATWALFAHAVETVQPSFAQPGSGLVTS